MYPAAFEYSAPTTLSEALSALEQVGDDGRVLAGLGFSSRDAADLIETAERCS